MISLVVECDIDHVWDDEGWQEFEDALCQLTEERLDDGEPLVLELRFSSILWKQGCGTIFPQNLFPTFGKRGTISFPVPFEALA